MAQRARPGFGDALEQARVRRPARCRTPAGRRCARDRRDPRRHPASANRSRRSCAMPLRSRRSPGPRRNRTHGAACRRVAHRSPSRSDRPHRRRTPGSLGIGGTQTCRPGKCSISRMLAIAFSAVPPVSTSFLLPVVRIRWPMMWNSASSNTSCVAAALSKRSCASTVSPPISTRITASGFHIAVSGIGGPRMSCSAGLYTAGPEDCAASWPTRG